MNKLFDKEEKEYLVSELERSIEKCLKYLEENDQDEEYRQKKLFPLIRLQNILKNDIIDRIEVTEEDDEKIFGC